MSLEQEETCRAHVLLTLAADVFFDLLLIHHPPTATAEPAPAPTYKKAE